MTQTYFDEVAADWDTMRSNFFPESLKETAADAMGVRKGGRYLDVGAGTGFLTSALVARGGVPSALDHAEKMVERLRTRFPGIDARAGDAEMIPFADGAFDGAFANMCLHHVEHPAVAIREMARVVKPGGRVVITDLDSHDFAFLRDEQHDRWMGFAREDILRWFREAGLQDARIESVGSDCCADSACGTEKARVSIFLATGTVASSGPV